MLLFGSGGWDLGFGLGVFLGGMRSDDDGLFHFTHLEVLWSVMWLDEGEGFFFFSSVGI